MTARCRPYIRVAHGLQECCADTPTHTGGHANNLFGAWSQGDMPQQVRPARGACMYVH
jgi:hypothetical protein